mmetsp:Transcript_18372/g.18459  ORF Transcript_18372/g.18459 Transcript_18372/m.18459 type:complete len:152 (-) Transcript_18372:36-491(-)
MFRRPGFVMTVPIRGRPYKKRNTFYPIHASQRPAESAEIDYSSLGLKYLPTHTPEGVITKIGWSKAPLNNPDLPFQIDRTLVGSSLPVYTDFKAGRTKVVTILRKCRGDISTLREEMEKICGREVKITPGKLQVDGNYHLRIKLWLMRLGF